jgi:glucarate dehydratase
MRIASIKVTPIAFRDPPLLNSSGVHEPYALRSIIEVESDTGLVGLGETYGDFPVLNALQALCTPLMGLDPFDLNGLLDRVTKTLAALPPPVQGEALAPGLWPSKQTANCFSAFEVAFLDLQAQQVGCPLADLLGGAVRKAVPFGAYLFFKYADHIDALYPPDRWGEAMTPQQIVDQARRMIEQYGFGSIKLKAGALAPDIEVASIRALAEAFPGYPLRIDPNANWSMETALRCADELRDVLQYYEDPVPALEGMAELRARTGLMLATNMVVTDFDEFRRNIALGGVQVVLSDHHYWGGLRSTQQLARMCEIFGLGMSMHSNSHLGISLMAMTHVAAATPNLSYACDTHYPWVWDEDEVVEGGKIAIKDGCVTITDQPGLGLRIDQGRLAHLHAQYLATSIRSRDDGAQMRKYVPDWEAKRPRW